MAWVVGIDEAGYGPNLGPFVMTAVACRLPDGLTGPELWQTLAKTVRRAADPDDGRLLIDDSKLVHAHGLSALEFGVLTALGGAAATTLSAFLDGHFNSSHAELRRECWYGGQTGLPVEIELPTCAELRQRWRGHDTLAWAAPQGVVVCAERFNDLTEQGKSKGAVLSHCLGELLCAAVKAPGDEPMAVYIDKHGGRNFYGPMLQQILPDCFVLARQESMNCSTYEIRGAPRQLTVTFEPRADAAHICVARASMVSKYLREVLMQEFNAFWLARVPGLKPTAGYPNDARRYYKAIQPSMAELGVSERAVWRAK